MKRAKDENGLTLIELLVTIAIMGIIAVPLSAALISYFQHTDETTNRLSVSHDAQIAAAYFAQDVASLGRHDWTTDGFPLRQSLFLNIAPGTGPYPCGPAGTPDAKVRLLWDDPSSGQGVAGVVRVAYVVTTVGGEQQLHRYMCDALNVLSDVVLAHNVVGLDDPVCWPTSCTDTSAVPQTVTLVLHLKSPTGSDTLDVTLTGQRRQT